MSIRLITLAAAAVATSLLTGCVVAPVLGPAITAGWATTRPNPCTWRRRPWWWRRPSASSASMAGAAMGAAITAGRAGAAEGRAPGARSLLQAGARTALA